MSTAQSRALRVSQNAGAGTKAMPANKAVSAQPVVANRRFASPRVAGPQSLILPSMVALGCWGMAFSFVYFYNDPNHLLFAGMAALMALLWSYSVYMRIRKLRAMRQKSM
ncbi:MAG TPA: hypothetical protein VIZ18_10970 [Ktedonobacteraceae bacterium]